MKEREEKNFKEACAHIGAFFYRFSHIELGINRLIGKALALDDHQTDIVSSIVPLQNKIKLLKAAIYKQENQSPHFKKHAISTLKKFMSYNDMRVTLAHQSFSVGKNGRCVTYKYSKVTSDGILKDRTETFSFEEIESQCIKMSELALEIKSIEVLMHPVVGRVFATEMIDTAKFSGEIV
ncbi:hypothetical protein [Methylobacterium sp. WSM2598]|uniref:hypothetical protein n=1 Tax=Methylobacterium sp. WSM2598 TaxID=398261 RepID=UPI0003A32788|nr:hypothetical protein [Methylobacterium sp. WSM2598]